MNTPKVIFLLSVALPTRSIKSNKAIAVDLLPLKPYCELLKMLCVSTKSVNLLSNNFSKF